MAYLSKSPTIRMGLEQNGMELARDLAATWEGFRKHVFFFRLGAWNDDHQSFFCKAKWDM